MRCGSPKADKMQKKIISISLLFLSFYLLGYPDLLAGMFNANGEEEEDRCPAVGLVEPEKQSTVSWDSSRIDRINQVIEDVNTIPVNSNKLYYFSSQGKGGITAEDVLAAFSDLAIFTLGVESCTATVKDLATGLEETIIGGEFGKLISRTLFGYQPDDMILVYNLGTLLPDGGSKGEINYLYEIYVNRKYNMRVELSPYYARPGGGCALGVSYIDNQCYIDTASKPRKVFMYELLFKHPDPEIFPELDPEKWASSVVEFTKLEDEQRTILRWQGWLFEEGNPDSIRYRPLGPP